MRIALAIGLFFLAPFTGEFLLGNIPITRIALLPVLALLYGSGALLIRELSRRLGFGWPTIVTWALAYGVVEEAFATQSLFNPNYAGLHLLRPGHIDALGMGAPWTLFVLTLHTVWSISVPIALMETLTRQRRERPWLGKIGLPVVGFLFLVGVAATAFGSLSNDAFVASTGQFVGAGIAVVVLVALGVVFGRLWRAARPEPTRDAPYPLLVGVVSLAAGSAFLLVDLGGKLGLGPWTTVAVDLVLFAAVAGLTVYCSRLRGWGQAHRLALAGGAFLAYAWHAFPQPPVMETSRTADLAGNALFAAIAVTLLVAATLRLRRGAGRGA